MKINYEYSERRTQTNEVISLGKKFKHLEHVIEKEYEKKGYSVKESKHIGQATAGKIFRSKK